jgi:uncharacterized protein YbcI
MIYAIFKYNLHEGGVMTKGQIEAKISEAVSKFEMEFMGRGPKQIKTLMIQDLIIIRLKGFLSQSEQKLAENIQGVELLKKLRTALFEGSRSYLETMIKNIIDVEIISIHSDVSTKTGEKIIVITASENLDEKFII